MVKEDTVLIGISGGIAAYKMLEVIDSLYNADIKVEVILTKSAMHFVSVEECKNYGARKVYTDLFADSVDEERILSSRVVEHIKVAKNASLFIIAPATADIIAKLATGIADDYLTTVALAVRCPIIVYPSMNTYMWTNPVTQMNIDILRQRGMQVITPDTGKLACGDEGKGRLPKVSDILSYITAVFKKGKALAGRKVIITFGGTREYIDDVRFITNNSSGKMGAALADAFFLKGADVIPLASASAVSPRFISVKETFETVNQLEQLLGKYIANADLIIHLAAVSDFQLEKKEGKLKSNLPLLLNLEPRKKILSKLKKWNPKCIVVGFKAVWDLSEADFLNDAKKALSESSVDIIVANDVGKKGRGFGEDTNEVIILSKSGDIREIPLASKTEVAEKIVDYIISII